MHETFKDTDFASRGWYEVADHAIINSDNSAPGTGNVLQCRFQVGDQVCAEGYPVRIEFPETESVYLSYWIRYSDNWEGSGRPYHPHEFHFTTNADEKWVGPANSHLTMYIEQINRTPLIAMQDSRNVDESCILLNDGTFEGCNGDFESYEFTEDRSVASCNGIDGLYDTSDCFVNGSYWYSARRWHAPEPVFTTGKWHFVEALLVMNEVENGVGRVNGSIRYWLNGELLISSDEILFRTGKHSEMAFRYFIFAPYIGDGSPVDQSMWVSDITVARGITP